MGKKGRCSRSKEDIIYYNQNIIEWKKSGLTLLKYCELNNIDYMEMHNVKHVLMYFKNKKQEYLDKFNPIIEDINSGFSYKEAVEKYGVSKMKISHHMNALRYKKIIDDFNKKKEKMNFVQIPKVIKHMEVQKEPELIEKQNDIEIIISKGIKVIVSPNIDSSSLIKIIELLKDI